MWKSLGPMMLHEGHADNIRQIRAMLRSRSVGEVGG